MVQRIRGYLRLMRPANIVTAVSDILAGIAIAGYFTGNDAGEIQLLPVVLLGSVLLLIGIIAACFVHNSPLPSGFIAVVTAIAALVYDKWGKHHSLIGPLNMGACRGFNLLLGISIIPAALSQYWAVSLIP